MVGRLRHEAQGPHTAFRRILALAVLTQQGKRFGIAECATFLRDAAGAGNVLCAWTCSCS